MEYQTQSEFLFINPYAGVNYDIPNIDIAYASTIYNSKVIDLNTYSDNKLRYLNYKTNKLILSIQSRTYSEAKNIIEKYKEKYPDTKILSLQGIINIQCCYPFISLDETLTINKPFSDELPFPDYELFDSFPIFQKNWERGIWGYAIMTSHGCPFQCVYCASRNRPYNTRSVDHCYEELKLAKEKWNIKRFSIIDDCFNVTKERVLQFCKKIQSLGMGWSCANGLRADRFDEEIAIALKQSGCEHISFGIESIDDEVLKIIKKGETREQIEKAVLIAKKHFESVSGFFIIGLPGSTYEKDLKSLNWAKKMKINAHFSYYVPTEKTLTLDAVFYGENAKPMSDVYPKELQIKIYKKTQKMRPQPRKNFLLNLFNFFRFK